MPTYCAECEAVAMRITDKWSFLPVLGLYYCPECTDRIAKEDTGSACKVCDTTDCANGDVCEDYAWALANAAAIKAVEPSV